MSIEQQNERLRQAQVAQQAQQGPPPFPIPGVEAWASFHNIAQELMNLIVAVEGNTALDGPGKREFVINAIFGIMKVVEMLEGDQFNDAAFREATGDFIDAFVAYKKTEQKVKDLVAASQAALNLLQEAIMGFRAARVEKAASRVVVAAPRIVLAGGSDTKR